MRKMRYPAYLAFIGVTLPLVFVIILSIRQYQLGTQYKTIITQSEEIIFHFSTVREQITTSLIERDYQKTANAADQLETLHSSLARLQEKSLIPDKYRLDLAQQVGLSGLAVSAKKIPTASDKLGLSLLLQDKLRSLAEYLVQFDRIIVSRMRARLIRFQAMMIGALGIVICVLSFSLIPLYSKKYAEKMSPLLGLAALEDDSDIRGSQDVNSNDAQEMPTGEQFREGLSGVINESNNISNGIINYAQLLKDSYREVEMGGEENKMLDNIIDGAERIAQLNKEI